MPRYKPLKFIPRSYNFSTFEDGVVDAVSGEEENALEEVEMEQAMIGMLKTLPNDRYRVLFLLQILRNDGYRLPHEALYKHIFKVHRSWYFRMVKRMKKFVEQLYKTT